MTILLRFNASRTRNFDLKLACWCWSHKLRAAVRYKASSVKLLSRVNFSVLLSA